MTPPQITREAGTIVTFYSYKGGTGRSMALANVAYLAARNISPRRVLMIDWDLEAPGLNRYFPESERPEHADRPGLIDYFIRLSELLTPENYQSIAGTEGAHSLSSILSLDDYITRDVGPSLDLIKAGRMDKGYPDRIASFDWVGLFRKHYRVYQAFRDQISARYEWCFIDSRTGFSDTSGICTMLMPEKLVMVFTPNRQSLDGVINLAGQAIEYRRSSDDTRPLSVFPLPSRIVTEEHKLLQGARERYCKVFEECLKGAYELNTCNLGNYFEEVAVPHKGFYGFNEMVASRDDPSATDVLSINRAYGRFWQRLAALDAPWDSLEEVADPNAFSSPQKAVEPSLFSSKVLPIRSASSKPLQDAEQGAPRTFRIFISYGSEEIGVASAVASCFKAALPDFFAEVNFGEEFLEPGSAFQTQIALKLQETDRLIIIYTGAEKGTRGYSGFEVGYFAHILSTDTGRRKKIIFYLFEPPPASVFDQGLSLGLSRDQLQLSTQEFQSALSVSSDEPLCKEISDWQGEVAKNIAAAGFPPPRLTPEQDPVTCVRNLKLAIFQQLKRTQESVIKPQRQIIIRVKGATLAESSDQLPPETELRPLGGTGKGGSMSIFGLSDESLTWSQFVGRTKDQAFSDSWQDSLTSVILSAFPDRIDVDNSQVIVASDGRTAYRIVLATAIKFYDDLREYNLYFIEMLPRSEYGDDEISVILKNLEILCRFHSLFLAPYSDFSGENVFITSTERLPDLANRLRKELILLHRDSSNAGFGRPGMWARYVEFEHIKAVSDAFRPCEQKLGELIPNIIAAKSQPARLEPLRGEMADALNQMQKATRPENALLIKQLASKLAQIVDDRTR